MSETYQIIFLKAGDGSPASNQSVAEKISTKTKTPLDRILKQIQSAPFIYKKGLPKSKADAIAAALTQLGAKTEVRTDEPAPAAASGGFDAGPSGASPPAGGYDFGSPASGSSAASGGFDFGGAPAPASSGFDFGGAPAAASSGFDFGGPPARPAGGKPGGDDFSIESLSGVAPPPASGGGGFGFDFNPQAAAPTAPPPRAPKLDIERNEDFGATTTAKAPAQQKKSTRKEETVVCPRCHHEQPPANECASCGVMMAKAGGAEAAAPPSRRPRGAVKQQRKSPVLTLAAVGLGAVVVLGIAFATGLLNPIRMRLKVGGDALLSEYGVSVAPPRGKYVTAVIHKPAKLQELEEGFVGKSEHIQQEIDRLAALSDLAQFDQQAQALQAEIGQYQSSPGNTLLKRVGEVAGAFYPVSGVGIDVGGKTYMFREAVEQSGAGSDPKVAPLLNEIDIRQGLKTARDRVAQQEAQRLDAERRTLVNVSFADSFEGGIGGRWQRVGDPAVALAGGKLRITAQPRPLAESAMLVVPEPVADYAVEVTLSSATADQSRGGLVIFQDARAYVGLVKSHVGGNKDLIQVTTQAADGVNQVAGRDVRVRIEHKGQNYSFSAWDGTRNAWVQLDRLQPAWNNAPPRQIAIVACNGQSAFDFDDFALQILQ